jgi:hypothetical protein
VLAQARGADDQTFVVVGIVVLVLTAAAIALSLLRNRRKRAPSFARYDAAVSTLRSPGTSDAPPSERTAAETSDQR